MNTTTTPPWFRVPVAYLTSAGKGVHMNDFKSSSRPITRKGLFLGLSAAAVGVAGVNGAAGGASSSDSPEVVEGAIEEIFPPSRLHVMDGDKLVEVVLTPNAHVARDRVSALADFEVGDDVVAEGQWKGRTFLAKSLTNVYLPFRAPVVSTGADFVETTAGRVRFIPETRLQRGTSLSAVSPKQYTAGQQFHALGRRDPKSGELIALRVADPD